MLASLLLVCAPPLLVVLLDLLLPPSQAQAQLPAHSPASVSFASTLLDQAAAFRFGSSLADLPAVSAARSLLILCAYTAFGGGAAYMWVAVACSVGSLGYLLAKAVAVFGVAGGLQMQGKGQLVAVEAMFLVSLALAAAHLAMAYRATCRERRRLLVYRIDVEAVSHPLLLPSPVYLCFCLLKFKFSVWMFAIKRNPSFAIRLNSVCRMITSQLSATN
ncbi:hypothetical protein PR202_ga27251 [Eleusine coracana subsp. coracana]|uniref:Uncharacterized protein n=1 Tax=Eleusine coracana subsp. coracana TaxID=191504 RepID=A0AAV5DG74_ELECO|nr:hypothetical protein PR202_ga27251 [Eleusine coracana subsp. coracana]